MRRAFLLSAWALFALALVCPLPSIGGAWIFAPGARLAAAALALATRDAFVAAFCAANLVMLTTPLLWPIAVAARPAVRLAFAVLLIAAQVIAVVFGFFWSSLTPFATPTLLVVYGMWVLSFLLATVATFLPVRAKDPLPRLG